MKISISVMPTFHMIHNYIKYFIWLIFLLILFHPLMNAQVTDSIYVERGWNLLSLPLKVVEDTKNFLFPTAISDAFLYQGNYLPKDTLENGYGFWLKFDTPDTIPVVGDMVYIDTIEVKAGWNMIGSLSMPIPKNKITPLPPIDTISDFYKYTTDFGYLSSDTIYPGLGYWVKVNQYGYLILSSYGLPCQVSSLPV